MHWNTKFSRAFSIVLSFILLMNAAVFSQSTTEKKDIRTVLTGIDVLKRDNFRQLRGCRVGLITNHTGIDQNWTSTVKLFNSAKGVTLVSLFSPEHGFDGKLDVAKINDSRDASTGIIVHSLYGKTRSPTKEMLEGIDTLVFDIQDIGTRFYTYVSTMGNAMRAASKHGIRFVVLDRPNPINGVDVQGPVLDSGTESFVGYHQVPVRHGMTTGELAQLFRTELKLKLDLKVIQLEGWNRSDFFDKTSLPWINPSPNMRSLNQAIIYPGLGLLEMTNLSVGRGTDTPFEVVGAPYVDSVQLARKMNSAQLSGVRLIPIRFAPNSSKFKGETCGGINIHITNRKEFDPLKFGLQLARTLRELYPEAWDTKSLNRLLSHQQTHDSLLELTSVDSIIADYQSELDAFKKRRKKYLLYPETKSVEAKASPEKKQKLKPTLIDQGKRQ